VRLTFFVGYFALHAALAVDAHVVWLAIPSWLVCCYNIARIKGPYATVEDMAWLILFVVFVIAPCQSLRFGYLELDGPASGIFFTEGEVAKSFAIIFLFLLVATVTNVLVRRVAPAAEPARYQMTGRSLYILLAFNMLAFVAYVVSEGGMNNVLADRHSKELSDDAVSSLVLTVAMAAQMVTCLLICVYAKCRPQRTLRGRLLVRATAAAALVLLLICQNPFNTARFFLLIGWLPIVLVFVSGRIGIKTFYLSVMFGLVVAMPILNQTSRFGTSLLEAAESIDLSSAFTIPGLDVFDMLIYEVRYLKEADFFWGGKTLGLLLFFVPRSIWTGKETVLASDMGVVLEDLGVAGTPNLSGFVAGDFYADLGMAGVVIGAVMVSLVLTYFGTKRAVLVHGFDLRAAIFMASLPILIRGALGSVLALTFLELTILAVLTRLLCRGARSKSRGSVSSSAGDRCLVASQA
jgi:hypothetical protein